MQPNTSFINKSVNHDQSILLKTKYLAPLLRSYNARIQTNQPFDGGKQTFIIPNNNRKYYLYVTSKSSIETCKENYNLLYFFPSDNTVKYYSQCKTTKHVISDFYLEINNSFNNEMLLEGYLYEVNGKYTYLLSDILVRDGDVVDCDYALRHCLLNELVFEGKDLRYLNDHLTIGVHNVFRTDNENMIAVFQNNFIFRHQLCAVEKINNFSKQQFVTEANKHDKQLAKRIENGKYADVYNVYNADNGDHEGILYIKGLKASKYIKAKLQNKSFILQDCVFNSTFGKWEPLLN